MIDSTQALMVKLEKDMLTEVRKGKNFLKSCVPVPYCTSLKRFGVSC